MITQDYLERGIASITLPLTWFREGSITVYLIRTSTGPILVDCGWADNASWDALVRGLADVDLDPGGVQGVVVTHGHPDHFGLAERIRAASGAWVAASRIEAELASEADPRADLERYLEYQDRILHRCGLDAEEIRNQLEFLRALAPSWPVLEVDRRLDDGDEIAEREGEPIRAVALPGHSRGHMGVADHGSRSLITGDSVLADGVSNIGEFDFSMVARPLLDDAIHSLRMIAGLGRDWRIFPAHGGEIRDVGLRCAHTESSHFRRLADVVAAVDAAATRGLPVTTVDVVRGMTWRTQWDLMDPGDRMLALAEATAHLHYLLHHSKVEVFESGGIREFRPVPSFQESKEGK